MERIKLIVCGSGIVGIHASLSTAYLVDSIEIVEIKSIKSVEFGHPFDPPPIMFTAPKQLAQAPYQAPLTRRERRAQQRKAKRK